MKVAELLVALLKKHDVKQVFGIPGDAINEMMEAIRTTDDIDFVQVKHEEGGAFAASIQAKLTGRLSVCMGTSGPGAVHLLNGLYDAKLDHAPVLAITGQVESQFIGTDYHQEIDTQRLFSDVAVYSQTVTSVEQFPAVIMEACRAAVAHKSVAHISIPSDVCGQSISFDVNKLNPSAAAGEIMPTSTDCGKAIELLASAKKTAILVGIGAQHAREELLALAEKIKAPIVRTLRAKSIIDDLHPLCAGGLGLLGGKPAIKAFKECDTLLMIGTDFPYQEFYPKNAKVIQVDLDPCQIGKRHPVDVAVVGHARSVLQVLYDKLDARQDDKFLSDIQGSMKKWLDDQAKDEHSDVTPIKPQRLVHEIGLNAPDNAIFVCDTGTINGWAARHLRVKSSQLFTQSSSLGSMGVGLPGAIGAQFSFPDRPVIALVGDGGLTMTMMELLTAARYELPIVVIVLNNSRLAFIGMEQQASGLPPFGIELNNPDFSAIANACGVDSIKVTEPGEIAEVLYKAMRSSGPIVVDVIIDPDELIIPPQIETGQALNFAKAKVKEWMG